MPDDLVTLATFDTAVEAELVRSHLEAAEIPCWLDNAEMATALWHYGNAIGHVRLNVAQSQSQAALEVIEKMLPAGQVDGAVGPVESFDESVGRNEQTPLPPELRPLFLNHVIDKTRCRSSAFALFRQHVTRPRSGLHE